MKAVYQRFAGVFLGLMIPVIGLAQVPSDPLKDLPGAARPAAHVPRDVFLYPELEPEPGRYIVPPVVDRPLGVLEGPRIRIDGIDLRGARDRPGQGFRVDDVWEIIERSRSERPDGHTIGELQNLANEITDFYRSAGFIVAQAFIPVQEVVDGVVTIQVLEGVLGKVIVEGGSRITAEQLARPFSGMLGEPLTNDEVETVMVRLTDYPGLTSFGVFQPGEVVGESDLVLKVQEEKGGDMKFSLNNHGSRFTGQYEAKATLGINNMFRNLDRLSLSLQQSFDPDLSQVRSFEYEGMFFKPQYRWSMGASQSDFEIEGTGRSSAQLSGFSRQAYLRVRNNYRRGRTHNAHVQFGIDRKTGKTLQSNRLLARDHLTVLTFEYGYDSLDTESESIDQLSAQFSIGLGHLLGAMKNYDDDRSSRRGASGEYAGGRFEKLSLNYTLLKTLSPTRSLLLRTQYQYTSDMLVGMEMFSLGGPNSVRAYPGSEATMDRGIFVSLEHIWNAPGFADKQSWFKSRKWGEVLAVSAYFDWAYGEKLNNLVSENRYASLKGWGLGAQLNVPGSFTSKLTAAWPTMNSKSPASNKRRPQVFFNFEAELF